MPIAVTWRNIFTIVALVATLLTGLLGGMSKMIQWRFDAIQAQLSDRLNLYFREIELIQRRLDRLEKI